MHAADDSDEEGEHIKVGQLEEAGEAEECDRRDDRASSEVRQDQDRPPLSPIDPHADQEAEQEERKGACGAQQSVLKRPRAEDVHGDHGESESRELVSKP